MPSPLCYVDWLRLPGSMTPLGQLDLRDPPFRCPEQHRARSAAHHPSYLNLIEAGFHPINESVVNKRRLPGRPSGTPSLPTSATVTGPTASASRHPGCHPRAPGDWGPPLSARLLHLRRPSVGRPPSRPHAPAGVPPLAALGKVMYPSWRFPASLEQVAVEAVEPSSSSAFSPVGWSSARCSSQD
jgi:hypothetical protein